MVWNRVRAKPHILSLFTAIVVKLEDKEVKSTDSAINQIDQGTRQMEKGLKDTVTIAESGKDTRRSETKQWGK